MDVTIRSEPSASAKYIYLVRSLEGEVATDIKDFRARVLHMEPTLNYAVACVGYAEARKQLSDELKTLLGDIRQQVDTFLESKTKTTTKTTKAKGRNTKGQMSKKKITLRLGPQKRVSKLVLHVRLPFKVRLQKLQADVRRLEGLVSRLPSIIDITKPQLHIDVLESTIEVVKARWKFLKTGSFGE